MLLDRHRAQSLLARLPEPPPDSARRLSKAGALLKAGVCPADLPVMLRRAEWGLSPTPAYAASLTLSDQGVVLGKGTVIVPLDDDPGLAVAGNEERILTLLSMARWGLAAPDMLEKIAGAHRFLARGEVGLAAIHLALSGQPPLAHRGEAEALDLAARELDKGMRPFDLLKGLGLLPGDARYGAWRKSLTFNEDEPRDYHGRWTDTGGNVQVADSRPANTVSDASPPTASPNAGDWRTMENPTDRIKDDDFEAMRKALGARTELTDLQKYNILSLYAWEGGLKDNGKGVIAGLTPTFLNENNLTAPKSAATTINLYLDYMDDEMGVIGGRGIADKIGDPVAAAALIDTIFYQGSGGGTLLIQKAINDVRRAANQPAIDEDEIYGARNFGCLLPAFER